jgi:Putative transmembrane protein (PGPGW)
MSIRTLSQAKRVIVIVVSATLVIGGLVLLMLPQHAHRILMISGGVTLIVVGLFVLVHPRLAKRMAVIIGGLFLLLAGLIMAVPGVPGPGFLAIIGALAILGSEFVWARKLLDRVKGTAERAKNAVLRKKTANESRSEKVP